MLNKAFWIWRRMKQKEEDFPAFHYDTDYNLALSLATAAHSKNKPSGDGRFARMENYAKGLKEEIAYVRRNWTGNDEELNAFLLGCDVIIIGMEIAIENIKKGP